MPKKLDLVDKKLLFALDMDARSSNAELGKQLRISKQAVQYRIDKLREEGIIKGFYTVIDLAKIGYHYVRFFIRFKDLTKEAEQEIINFSLSQPEYGWVVSIDGTWDFCAALLLRDNLQIKEVTNRFLSRYGGYIEDYEISIATEIEHLQNRFLLGKRDGAEVAIGGGTSWQSIDDLDQRILVQLSQDGRKRLNAMASELGESYKVISYRMNIMRKKGIIKCFRADLDYNALGYTHYKIFINLKDFTPEKVTRLKTFIKQHPNSIYITDAIGLAEIEFEVIFDNYSSLHDLLQNLKTEFSSMIRRHYTIILYRFYQINYLPCPPEEEKNQALQRAKRL